MRCPAEYQRGAEAAAAWADEYNGSTIHAYRLGDCILGKMNLLKRDKPRRNERKLEHPEFAVIQGIALGLAEMHRRLVNGNDSTCVCEVARATGITIALCKKAGVAPFDWKELQRAGVPNRVGEKGTRPR